jgi:LysM repeat protein
VSVDKIKSWNHLTTDKVSVGQQLSINTPATVTAQKPPVQPQQQPMTDYSANNTPANKPQDQPKTEQQTETVVAPPTNNTPVETAKPKVKAESQPMIADGKDTYVDPSKVSTQGYFTSLFGVDVDGRSLESTNGVSMTFKTASGWTDKKYYILINDVPPGSIVKVTSPATNKIIYAKVLWKITDTKENDGLNFRISNAAADALGVTDTKFPLTVTYYE